MLARRILATLLAMLLVPGQPLCRPEAPTTRAWAVEFRQGNVPDVGRNRNLMLQIEEKFIRLRLRLPDDRLLREIRADAVTALVYDTHLSSMALGVLGGGGGGSASGMANAGAVLLIVPLLLAPFVDRQHFVTIVWNDDEDPRMLTIQVKDGDTENILAALSAACGVAWRDAPAERRDLEAQFDSVRPQSFLVPFEPDLVMADTRFAAGSHRAALFNREAGRAELLIFRGGDMEPDEVLFRTPVVVQPDAGAVSAGSAPIEARRSDRATVVYRDEPTGPTVSEIRIRGESLILPRFTVLDPELPRPVPHAAGPTLRFQFLQYAQAQVTWTDCGGADGFRFIVLHLGWNTSFGTLCVTPSDVSYDPGDSRRTSKQRFTEARAQVEVLLSAEGSTGMFLRLLVAGRGHSFRIPASPAPGVGLGAAMRHDKRRREVESRLVSFARLAIEDFEAARRQFDDWLAPAGLSTGPTPAAAPAAPATPETPTLQGPPPAGRISSSGSAAYPG